MILYYYNTSKRYCLNHYKYVYSTSRPLEKFLLLCFYFLVFPFYLIFLNIIGALFYIICFLFCYYSLSYFLCHDHPSALKVINKDMLYLTFSISTGNLFIYVPVSYYSTVFELITLLFIFLYFFKDNFEDFD